MSNIRFMRWPTSITYQSFEMVGEMTNLANSAKEESIGWEGHLLYGGGGLAVPQLRPLRQFGLRAAGRHPVIMYEELNRTVNLGTVPHLYELTTGQQTWTWITHKVTVSHYVALFKFWCSLLQTVQLELWLLSPKATLNFSTGWKYRMFLPFTVSSSRNISQPHSIFLPMITDFNTE